MSSRVLGLDIRSHLVTGIVVRSGFKSEKIETHFQVPLPGEGDFDSEFSSAIDQIASQIDTKELYCQVAVPAEWAIYRNVDIPIKGKSKIRQVLPYELEPVIAQPVELFTFDFLPFSMHEEDSSGHILAGGIERERLDLCLDMLVKAQLDPDLVTAGSFGLAGCLPEFIGLSEKSALVTVDGGVSSVYLLLSGQIAMARTFRLSSGLKSYAEFIIANFNQTISAFEEQFNIEFDVQTLYLSGNHPDGKEDSAPALEENCGCPVHEVNLPNSTGLQLPSTQDVRSMGPLNNALALILVRTKGIKILDFRRGGYGKRMFFTEHRSPLIKTAVLTGVLLLFGILAIILDGFYTKRTLNHLDEQVAAVFKTVFPDVRRIVDPLQQMKVKIREEKDRISQMGVTERKVAVIDVLNDISGFIPPTIDVTLTGITIGPENMTLSGHADNFEMVNDMRAVLEKANWVSTAIISSANRDKSGQRVDYKIKLVFENRPKPKKS